VRFCINTSITQSLHFTCLKNPALLLYWYRWECSLWVWKELQVHLWHQDSVQWGVSTEGKSSTARCWSQNQTGVRFHTYIPRAWFSTD